MSEAPPPKKKESWRGVVSVGVLCVAFLWFWFSLENVPEDVGAEGLADRALAELVQHGVEQTQIIDFDLLEISMLQLRARQMEAAQKTVERIRTTPLKNSAWRAIALAHLGKDAGSMVPALSICSRIKDPHEKTRAESDVLVEMARLGLGDVALEKATTSLVKAAVIRVLAETDGQESARQALPALEAAAASATGEEKQQILADLAWAHLWLKNESRVFELSGQLKAASRSEILAELFRMGRLENPARTRELLDKMPEEMKLALRIEAARLNGNLETPAALAAEIRAQAETVKQPTAATTAWLRAARAEWEIAGDQPSPSSWKDSAKRAEDLASSLKGADQAAAFRDLAALYFDGLDIQRGRDCFRRSREITLALPNMEERASALAKLLELGFRSSEPDEVQLLLRDAKSLLEQHAPAAPEAKVLADTLFREGAWADALAAASKVPEESRAEIQSSLAGLVIESAANQGMPVSQDRSLAEIRQVALNQGETAAAHLAMRLKPGQERARAWLEMAKALVFRQQIEKDESARTGAGKASPASEEP